MSLKVIHTKNLRWVDVINPGETEIAYLKENFNFHPLDFDDVMTPSTRPKIDEYENYHFIILLFPLMSKDTGEVRPAEVDFFVGKGFVVTIHDGSMKTLTNLTNNVSQYDSSRSQYMAKGSGFLLFSILELLFKRSFPILDTINHEMEHAGKRIFSLNTETLQKMSQLKKNIIVYRRIMKMHKFVLGKLARKGNEYLQFPDGRVYFQNLIEYAENIWDVLASDKETVESFEETNQSLAAHRMNDILRTLTVFSVIIFILTLFVNIMMFVENTTNIAQFSSVLPMTIALLLLITVTMLTFFKNRKWL